MRLRESVMKSRFYRSGVTVAPNTRNGEKLAVKVNQSGTDVMILKIFTPKNLAKELAFFSQTTAIFL
jgi:hypothetical protein